MREGPAYLEMLFARAKTEQGKGRLSVACTVSAYNLLSEENWALSL